MEDGPSSQLLQPPTLAPCAASSQQRFRAKQPFLPQPGPKSHGPALPTHSNPTGWISQNIRLPKWGKWPMLERGRWGECGAGDCIYQQCINPLLPASRLPGEPHKHSPDLEAKQSGWYLRVIYYFLPCQIALEWWLTSRQRRFCFKDGRVWALIQDRLSGPEWTSFLWYPVAS